MVARPRLCCNPGLPLRTRRLTMGQNYNIPESRKERLLFGNESRIVVTEFKLVKLQ
jgi:hypothetical protein